METEQETPTKLEKVKPCLNCGKDFTYKLARAVYCSGSCRSTHSIKRKKTGEQPEKKKEESKSETSTLQVPLNGLPPHAAYIINHQEGQIKDWKKRYEEEREERKKLKDKVQELKEQMQEEKRAQELKGLEDARPGFLDQIQAFVPESVREKVMGALADKLLNMQTPGDVGGIEKPKNTNWQAIQNWYASMPPNFQQKIYEMLNGLAMIPDAKKLELKLTQIINLLSAFSKMRNGSNN